MKAERHAHRQTNGRDRLPGEVLGVEDDDVAGSPRPRRLDGLAGLDSPRRLGSGGDAATSGVPRGLRRRWLGDLCPDRWQVPHRTPRARDRAVLVRGVVRPEIPGVRVRSGRPLPRVHPDLPIMGGGRSRQTPIGRHLAARLGTLRIALPAKPVPGQSQMLELVPGRPATTTASARPASRSGPSSGRRRSRCTRPRPGRRRPGRIRGSPWRTCTWPVVARLRPPRCGIRRSKPAAKCRSRPA